MSMFCCMSYCYIVMFIQLLVCRSVLLDERYFGSHRKETVLKVLWHPGSPNGSHLCVLCSDDVLR